jgi:hypothetical protein
MARTRMIHKALGAAPAAPKRTPVKSVSSGYAYNKRTNTTRTIDSVSTRNAKRAIRAGDSAVAAERPVLAARIQARQQGLGRKATRAAVRTARANPNSARSERRAARGY